MSGTIITRPRPHDCALQHRRKIKRDEHLCIVGERLSMVAGFASDRVCHATS